MGDEEVIYNEATDVIFFYFFWIEQRRKHAQEREKVAKMKGKTRICWPGCDGHSSRREVTFMQPITSPATQLDPACSHRNLYRIINPPKQLLKKNIYIYYIFSLTINWDYQNVLKLILRIIAFNLLWGPLAL